VLITAIMICPSSKTNQRLDKVKLCNW